MIHNQTNRLSVWLSLVCFSIHRARRHRGKLFWFLIPVTLFVSEVICCQLTGLIGMAGRVFWGGMRSSCTCTLGSCTGCEAYPHSLLRLSQEERPFWQTASLTKASPRVQKGADKALLALKTWLQYKSH